MKRPTGARIDGAPRYKEDCMKPIVACVIVLAALSAAASGYAQSEAWA